jgi:hypothetical protein
MNTEDSTTATDLPKALPFEDMTKADMAEHLLQFHNYSIGMSNSRWTKESAIAQHSRLHREYDENVGNRRSRTIEHAHMGIEQSAEQQKRFDAVLNGALPEKPLNASERRILKELVDNDFNRLKAEMRQFSADALAAALAEVEEEWKDKGNDGPRYVSQMQALADRTNAEAERLIEEARSNGVEIGGLSNVYARGGYRVVGKDEAIQKVRVESDATLNRALLTLDQQRLATQRTVMLSGVNAESRKLLDTLPSARAAMIEASKTEQERKQINA